jgi:hypothetical protein
VATPGCVKYPLRGSAGSTLSGGQRRHTGFEPLCETRREHRSCAGYRSAGSNVTAPATETGGPPYSRFRLPSPDLECGAVRRFSPNRPRRAWFAKHLPLVTGIFVAGGDRRAVRDVNGRTKPPPCSRITLSRTPSGCRALSGDNHRGCRCAHPRLISVTPLGVGSATAAT